MPLHSLDFLFVPATSASKEADIAMSDSLTLPLRVLNGKQQHARDTIPVEIAQISSQWGSFRDVTESKLQVMIDEGRGDATAEAEDGDELPIADVDRKERFEELYKRRAEITQFALQAHMEAMFALDFISLLVSKYAPRQTEASLSAHLKQIAPLGSLNVEIVNPPAKTEATVNDINAVSVGWKLQGFNLAARKLLSAATRLEEEVTVETKYWAEILAVKSKGWKLCRMPHERQTLGVQYGFLEALPVFRDRGLASLRRGLDGCLVLDKGLAPSHAVIVRVRIKDHGRLTGVSILQGCTLSGAESVQARILRARDTAYEEELFYELAREARCLAGHGAITRHNSIMLPGADEQEILIDLVDTEQDSDFEESEICSREDDQLAEAISHAIRVLLAIAHRQNLYRRMQIPASLSSKRRLIPEYPLLRPVLAYLQHMSHVKWFESLLRDVYCVLNTAKLNCGYTCHPLSSINLSRRDRPVSTVEVLAEEFLRPLVSSFSCSLATPGNFFKVNIRTNPYPPLSGTNYDIQIDLPQYPQVQLSNRVGLRHEAEAMIIHIMLLDLVSTIASHQAYVADATSQETLPKEMSEPLSWEPAYPHHGELLCSPSASQQKRKLKVRLSRTELTLRVYHIRGPDSDNHSGTSSRLEAGSYTWRSDQLSLGQPSLVEYATKSLKA